MGAALRLRLVRPSLPIVIALGNALLLAVLVRGGLGLPLLLALTPLTLLLVGILFSSHRELLVFAALALPMTFDALGDKQLALGGGFGLYSSDILVLLAIGPWLASRLVGRHDLAPSVPRTPVLAWPFVLFAAALLQALLRGHFDYGQALVSQPLRMILYATIVTALVGLDARRAFRGIVVVFYVGTVYVFLYALYLLASGRNITSQGEISTGGTRVLAGTIAMAMAAALVLALLNLRIDSSAHRRGLHLGMALLAATNVVLSYQRTTLVALVVILPLLFVTVRKVAGPFLSIVPLALPFLAIVAIFLPQVAPELLPTFVNRITATTEADTSLQTRERLGNLQWNQAQESPLTGVGFGRLLEVSIPVEDSGGFTVYRQSTDSQEGHNSFLWLLAAGGFGLLGAFLLMLVTYAVDLSRRLLSTRDEYERVLLIWCGLSLFVILMNALASPSFTKERTLLAMWILLLLPSIVSHKPRRHQSPARRGVPVAAAGSSSSVRGQ
jgi:O-antigen ligase/polysaccharide polymerase Wzy-like membrane protein